MNSTSPDPEESAAAARAFTLVQLAGEAITKVRGTAWRQVLVAANEPLETLLLDAWQQSSESGLHATRLSAHEGSLSDDQAVLLAFPVDLQAVTGPLNRTAEPIQVFAFSNPEEAPDLNPLIESGWRFRKPQLLERAELLEDRQTLRRGERGPFRVRSYRAGDEVQILELFRTAFHVVRDPDHWFWKYRDQPYGSGHISLVLDDSSNLVGQYCAYPVPIEMEGGESHTVHQVGDTMTSEEVRSIGRGHSNLLATTAEHFYSSFCRGQVRFNYGFNTGAIQRFTTGFLGGHAIEDVHFRTVQSGRVESSRRGGVLKRLASSLRGQPTVQEIQTFDERFDSFFQEARPHYGSLIRRDRTYLDWRYAQRPDLNYRIFTLEHAGQLLGWGVFARREQTLVWGDALFLPKAAEHAGSFLRTVLEALQVEGPIDEVVTWTPERPDWWDRAVTDLGFERAPEPEDLRFVVVTFEKNDAGTRELVQQLAESSYYTYGDSDLF